MDNNKQLDIDNPQSYKGYDRDDMLGHIRNFPQLCEQAWQMAQNFQLPESYQNIKKILILGMGGSAIGGDLIAGLLFNQAAVPISICRDYYLPKYVDKDTLVIASSYSGMTEETISAFEQAYRTEAKKLAITTGGKLQSLCESRGTPVFTFDYKSSPRAALPFSFFLLLGLLQNIKVIKNQSDQVYSTIKELGILSSKINENVASSSNIAKLLAIELKGRIPIIYGGGINGPVAQRWKTQMNENSKTTAFYEFFSELNHNAIMGYQFPKLLNQCLVIMLDSEFLHERIRLRYRITQTLLKQAEIPFKVVTAEGSIPLSQMIGMVMTGDYVSYYLALLNGVDPTEIKSINFLKESLAAE